MALASAELLAELPPSEAGRAGGMVWPVRAWRRAHMVSTLIVGCCVRLGDGATSIVETKPHGMTDKESAIDASGAPISREIVSDEQPN